MGAGGSRGLDSLGADAGLGCWVPGLCPSIQRHCLGGGAGDGEETSVLSPLWAGLPAVTPTHEVLELRLITHRVPGPWVKPQGLAVHVVVTAVVTATPLGEGQPVGAQNPPRGSGGRVGFAAPGESLAGGDSLCRRGNGGPWDRAGPRSGAP